MKRKAVSVVALIVLAASLGLATTEASAGPLYAGTSSSTGDAKVYSYQGGTTWTAISGPLGNAVLDIIEYEGDLYAATMSSSSVGEVYRYQGGTSWALVETNMDNQVADLEIHNGQLYAGTAWNGGKLYRYNAVGDNFDYVGSVSNFSGIRALYSSSYGYLQLGDIGYDKFGRYDGNTFTFDVDLGGSCIYDFAEYNNKLYASAWVGDLHGSADGVNWAPVLGPYDGYMWELETFQDRLYMGYDNGELAKLDTAEARTLVWTATDGITAMTVDGNSTLYFGIGGEAGYAGSSGIGEVYAYTGSGAPTLISGSMDLGIQTLYIPEPTTLVMLTLGGFAVIRKRRTRLSD